MKTAPHGPWRLRGAVPGLTLGASLVLTGCVSLIPPLAPVPLPVATAYPADAPDTAGPTTPAAAAIGWRDYFADAQLRTLIATALEHNRDLRAMVLRVGEARALHGIQRADLAPTLRLGADGVRARQPADLNLTGRPLTASDYEVGLSVATWELDFWGRVKSLNRAALENFLATDEARRAATLSLVAELANAYLVLRELDERHALAAQTVASRAESLRIFTRRHAVGAISKLELTQVETLLTQAQTLLAQLALARATQAHALSLLAGVTVAFEAPLGQLDDAAVLHELRAGLPSALLGTRPDIVAAEHRLLAAQANIGAARAAFFPRVSLTGALGSASAELGDLFAAGSLAWQFAPGVSLPIFDGGRNRANLQLAGIRRDLAVANYERVVQGAFRDVSDALSQRQWLAVQVEVARAALAAQTERARLARLRYDNGAAAFLEVLDAQRDLLLVEQQLVQTRRTLLSSRVNLYAALGGGSMTLTAAPAERIR